MFTTPIAWRAAFAAAALFLLAGGPRHPDGTMAQMLADPEWVPSHALMLAGFVALAVGLVLYQRAAARRPRTRLWIRAALWGTVLQALEMAVHTAAVVDHHRLVSGSATPVLTTHLWMSVVLYPLFAATMIGLIVATVRDGTLGSPWIAWIGIVGAVGHGLAAPLVAGLGMIQARVLFPLLAALGVWLLLVAVWPARVQQSQVGATKTTKDS